MSEVLAFAVKPPAIDARTESTERGLESQNLRMGDGLGRINGIRNHGMPWRRGGDRIKIAITSGVKKRGGV